MRVSLKYLEDKWDSELAESLDEADTFSQRHLEMTG